MSIRVDRLYQRDSLLDRFEAEVVSVARESGGSRIAVLLDRTAFYPEGGGQPFDTGTLAGLPVVEVREGPEGPLHILEVEGAGEPPEAGRRVTGVIDRERRFDHMQQHSGQHLLSRAFLEVAGARTRSFHLGSSICTIDVEMAPPHEAKILQAARRANEVIWADLPVEVRESEAPATEEAGEDLALSGLRLKPGDRVRTITVEGFDATPCGGTHVSRTGQVGVVAVTAWEPWKRLSRITFLCGARVVAHVEEARGVLGACVAALSAPPPEIPAALARLLSDKEALHRKAGRLTGRIAQWEADAAAAGAPEMGGFRLLARVLDGPDQGVEEAQALIRSFVGPERRIAVVAVTGEGKATLLAGRSRGEGPPLGTIVAEVARAAGGRGGGSAESARAGGFPAEMAGRLVEEATARIEDALTGGSS